MRAVDGALTPGEDGELDLNRLDALRKEIKSLPDLSDGEARQLGHWFDAMDRVSDNLESLRRGMSAAADILPRKTGDANLVDRLSDAAKKQMKSKARMLGLTGRRMLDQFDDDNELNRRIDPSRRLPNTSPSDDPGALTRFRAKQRIGHPAGVFETSPEFYFVGTEAQRIDALANIRRGMAGVDTLIRDRVSGKNKLNGVLPNVMVDPDGELVSFAWGKPGNVDDEFEGGKGLSHIIAKHGVEHLEGALETIAKGKVDITDQEVDRRKDTKSEIKIIRDGDRLVILQRFRTGDEFRRQGAGKRGVWVVTGYEKDGTNVRQNLQEIEGGLFFTPKN